MDSIGNDAISILQYLLPGFLAAWIFYGLTPYELPSQFERLVHALILTLIIQAALFAAEWAWAPDDGPPIFDLANGQSKIVGSTLIAVAVGLLFSYCANHDTLHGLARKLAITQETSYSSEWFGAFCANITYVVLQLSDERRIYGWPREWPSDYKEGHFILEQPSWLMPDGL